MLYISESARNRVLQIMEQEQKDDSWFVRVSVTSGGCSGFSYHMEFDNELKPDDQVFEDKGIRLVTDIKSVLYLFGTTLNFSDGLNGKGFYFENPNASRTCSCGESFAV